MFDRSRLCHKKARAGEFIEFVKPYILISPKGHALGISTTVTFSHVLEVVEYQSRTGIQLPPTTRRSPPIVSIIDKTANS